MGLSDDVDDPVTTPVDGAFASMHMADDNARAKIDVTADEVWDGQESTRVAYTRVSIGAFRFTVHLEGDDARAVAHDLLQAVGDTDEYQGRFYGLGWDSDPVSPKPNAAVEAKRRGDVDGDGRDEVMLGRVPSDELAMEERLSVVAGRV